MLPARFARGSFSEVVPVHRLAYSFGWDASEYRGQQNSPLNGLPSTSWPIVSASAEELPPITDVEKLEFLRRSQGRRPLAASTKNSLGIRQTNRSCHVRPSHQHSCSNYRCRRHCALGSEIFAVPQFRVFQQYPSIRDVTQTSQVRKWRSFSDGATNGSDQPDSGRLQQSNCRDKLRVTNENRGAIATCRLEIRFSRRRTPPTRR
jgi:hypothetical protein